MRLELTSKDHLFLLQPSKETAGCSEGSAQDPLRLSSTRSSSPQLHLRSCLQSCASARVCTGVGRHIRQPGFSGIKLARGELHHSTKASQS